MTTLHVISRLLESDTKYPENLFLLKKLIVIAYFGRLRINGQAPDDTVALGSYLFDQERFILDLTELGDEYKERFKKWLLSPHQNQKQLIYTSSASIHEHKGYTTEDTVGWFGRLWHWIKRVGIDYWRIAEPTMNLDYQLTGIEMCHGDYGILVGFEQYLVPALTEKYKASGDGQPSHLKNTKRIHITEPLVVMFETMDFNYFNGRYESLCKSAHPQSIQVSDLDDRYKDMYEYRMTKQFIVPPSWYVSLFQWVASPFAASNTVKNISKTDDNKLNLLYETKTIKIYERAVSHKIVVYEKRPDINTVIWSGGGSKIYGHVGCKKALEEYHIDIKRYFGTSAGAIMAMFCYLGYTSDELEDVFKNFRREDLVLFEIDRSGLSDSHSLKTALDYLVAKKLQAICDKHHLPYPKGKITFRVLDELRQKCPESGIQEELIVNTTNKKQRKTRLYSHRLTPDYEVTRIVTASASIPLLYKPTVIDEEEHNDGGVLLNSLTGLVKDDRSTLLGGEYGTNFKILPVVFDNGVEYTAINHSMWDIPRENFIWNGIYSLVTGVYDPVSDWMRERHDMRKNSSQTILINTGPVDATNFTVEESVRKRMINSGYESTIHYLEARYDCIDEVPHNREWMYATFSSLGDLLSHCCYRGDREWFEVVNNLIIESKLPNTTALRKQAILLRNLYFSSWAVPVEKQNRELLHCDSLSFFGKSPSSHILHHANIPNHKVLLVLYPIFLKLIPELVDDKADKAQLERARHKMSLQDPYKCIKLFEEIKGTQHIALYVLRRLLVEFRDQGDEVFLNYFEKLHQVFYGPNIWANQNLFGKWQFGNEECLELLDLMCKNDGKALEGYLHKKPLDTQSSLDAAQRNQGSEVLHNTQTLDYALFQ